MHRIHAGLAVPGVLILALVVATGLACVGAGALPANDPGRGPVAAHLAAGIFGAAFLLLVHVIAMFYLIGTGAQIKEVAGDLPDGGEVLRRTRRFKAHGFPFATMSILFLMATAVIGAGAHTHAVPGWVHGALAVPTVFLNLVAFVVEYRVLRANAELIRQIDREWVARAAERAHVPRPGPPRTPASPAAPPRESP